MVSMDQNLSDTVSLQVEYTERGMSNILNKSCHVNRQDFSSQIHVRVLLSYFKMKPTGVEM